MLVLPCVPIVCVQLDISKYSQYTLPLNISVIVENSVSFITHLVNLGPLLVGSITLEAKVLINCLIAALGAGPIELSVQS